MVKVATEPRFLGSCYGINTAIPLTVPLDSPNNGTQTLGMILEMPHSSAKLSKFSWLLCFEPIQLHLSVNSQALSIRQLKCLTCTFILWEFRSVSGYKVPDFPSPSQQVWPKHCWLHRTAFPFPRKVCKPLKASCGSAALC